MPVRFFTMIVGFVFLFVGLAGFVPATLHTPPLGAPELTVESGYGYLFGLFPVNAVHSAFHIGIGFWGLWAYRRFATAKLFAQRLAIIYGVFAVLGLIPGFRSVFGLIPIWGLDVWLHAGTAAVAAYFGFGERSTVQVVESPAR